MKLATIWLSISAIILMTRPACAETAGQVNTWCQPFDSATESTDSTIYFNETNDSMFCWGAFAAIQRATRYADKNGPVLNVCTPPESTRLELVHVYRRYIEAHPEKEHLDFVDTAFEALIHAYPCKRR